MYKLLESKFYIHKKKTSKQNPQKTNTIFIDVTFLLDLNNICYCTRRMEMGWHRISSVRFDKTSRISELRKHINCKLD